LKSNIFLEVDVLWQEGVNIKMMDLSREMYNIGTKYFQLKESILIKNIGRLISGRSSPPRSSENSLSIACMFLPEING